MLKFIGKHQLVQVPLEDDTFNRAKSSVKFVVCGALGEPVCLLLGWVILHLQPTIRKMVFLQRENLNALQSCCVPQNQQDIN
jgi:hypothetical protein